MSGVPLHYRLYATTAQVARDLGVNQSKVLGWIKRGELAAVNVANRANGRPRWRIPAASFEAFVARRSAAPTPKVTRRRKSPQKHIIEFF